MKVRTEFNLGDKVRLKGHREVGEVESVRCEVTRKSKSVMYGVKYQEYETAYELNETLLELAKERPWKQLPKSRKQQIHELRNQQRADDKDRKIRFEHAINK